MTDPMRIAMIGQRGVPASFGGIERHVEEIGRRLVERGHHVTVFCRPNYVTRDVHELDGMTVHHLRTYATKHLDAGVHSALATLAAMRQAFDVLHFHAIGPGLMTPLPRYASRRAVVQTIHGLDHDRAKWGSVARRVLRTGAWMSAHVPHRTIVVSRALAEHYRQRYGRDVTHIPNGVKPAVHREPDAIRQRFGLEGRDYILFVGRFVPEKAPDALIRAFQKLDPDLKLVLVGNSSFTDAYTGRLHDLAKVDERIVMPGYLYGDVLDELYSNAAMFVLPSFVEGLPLTILEAATHGVPIVASNLAPHHEILGECDRPGVRFCAPGSDDDIARAIDASLATPADERDGARATAEDIAIRFPWSKAVDDLEAVYEQVTAPRR